MQLHQIARVTSNIIPRQNSLHLGLMQLCLGGYNYYLSCYTRCLLSTLSPPPSPNPHPHPNLFNCESTRRQCLWDKQASPLLHSSEQGAYKLALTPGSSLAFWLRHYSTETLEEQAFSPDFEECGGMVGVWKAHYPNHLCYLQLGCELLIVYIILYCTLVVAIIQITHNCYP